MTIVTPTRAHSLRLALVTLLTAIACAAHAWDMPDTHASDLAPVQFSQLSAGATHTLGLSNVGTVWAWGNNRKMQLGIPGLRRADQPMRVLGALAGKKVRRLVAAGSHSLALTEDGEVYAWGSTTLAPVFGYAPDIPQTPTRVEGALRDRKVVTIGARDYANYAVTEDGELFEWLRDSVDANGVSLAQPIALLPGRRVLQVVGGTDIAGAIDDSGALWVWGTGVGPNGELGPFEERTQPVRVAALSDKVITQLAAGGEHVLAASAQGEVFAWGNNYWGQLGTGSTGGEASRQLPVSLNTGRFLGKVVKLSADRNASYAITEYGLLYAWGWNDSNQLPLPAAPTGQAVSVPTLVQGAVFQNGVSDVDGGYSHGVALARDGSVLVWGSNSSGQLGTGAPLPRLYSATRAQPVSAPASLLLPHPGNNVSFIYPTLSGDTVRQLPMFYGSGAPGTAVMVVVSASKGSATGQTLCTATINSSGYWNCAPATPLNPDEFYSVRAFAFVDGRPIPPNDVSFVTAPY